MQEQLNAMDLVNRPCYVLTKYSKDRSTLTARGGRANKEF